MNKRCYSSTAAHFAEYGARGIAVCDRWRHSFDNFLADLGLRPSLNHSLDRIDNNGNYEPGNCRWATKKQQASNQRRRAALAALSLLWEAVGGDEANVPPGVKSAVRHALAIHTAGT